MTGQEVLPEALREILRTGQTVAESGEHVPLASNVSAEEALLLYDAVRTLRPANSAEVGLAQGISATAILKAMEDLGHGTHYVMDPFQANYGNAGLALVKRAGLETRFRFNARFAEDIFPTLPALQFVFVDSSHLFDLTISEFVLADKKLAVGGLIAFHDTWMASIQKVIRYLLANRSYRLRLDLGGTPPVRQAAWKTLLARGAAALPGAKRIFRQELLEPWGALNLGNLVFLEKTAADQRDWRFHESF